MDFYQGQVSLPSVYAREDNLAHYNLELDIGPWHPGTVDFVELTIVSGLLWQCRPADTWQLKLIAFEIGDDKLCFRSLCAVNETPGAAAHPAH